MGKNGIMSSDGHWDMIEAVMHVGLVRDRLYSIRRCFEGVKRIEKEQRVTHTHTHEILYMLIVVEFMCMFVSTQFEDVTSMIIKCIGCIVFVLMGWTTMYFHVLSGTSTS